MNDQDYAQVEQSPKFQALVASKKRFLFPMTLFFLVFYFALPILTSYSKVLNQTAFGPVSWAWVFAFAQFIMTWVLCIIYSKKSVKFDQMVDEIKQERGGQAG
ncbi:DUF485 domain-containing protein [Paenibacillus hexagrammi]|uniref:DUF485 domain-containing protein n=1 Tax=Paenibacillus hexagrammi TaxID=2908839 RepID=A0ABY3SQ87_9BACL|nr:DUF485 domain-containing protein [Paenibacillus sp. YPD9-1]UJF36218.1 DUF485 domain-containing protein [Paenibacillus sp. YPD9-1]